MLPLSIFACSGDGQQDPPKEFDPKTAGDLVNLKTLTPIEKRLNAIIVPEIDFRCANMYDIIDFYDECVKKYGGDTEKDDNGRVRLSCDKTGFGPNVPLIHFSSLKMPLLYALRLTCALGDVNYRINGNTLTVYKPEKTDGAASNSTSAVKEPPSAKK